MTRQPLGRATRALRYNRAVLPAHPDVTVDADVDGLISIKLQTPGWELNLSATADELEGLRNIDDADWTRRRSIRAGMTAAAPVFWAREDNTVSLLIGADDETWDIALIIPRDTVDVILREVDRCIGRPPCS